MEEKAPQHHEHYPDEYHDTYSKTTFGFWLYLVSDFILFGVLFAVYLVLKNSTFGGPKSSEIFDLTSNLIQTIMFSVTTFISGLGGAYAHRNNKKATILCFAITFLFGLIFMGMEYQEFNRMALAGHTWRESAFLSGYFTVIGTFWIHVILALLWTLLIIIPLFRREIDLVSLRRITCLRMFWQFLNIIWIFIFTIVYLIGGA